MSEQINQDVWAQMQCVNGAWFCDGVALLPLVERYGSPLYVYSAAYILARYHAYHAHSSAQRIQLHYAVKANSNLAILRLLADAGAGFDIVSVGELMRVLQIGAEPAKIVFSGVAKTDDELCVALDANIGCFNVESREELLRLAAFARARGMQARIALRVNPDVDPQTHPYISTGLKENKFGVAMSEALTLYREAATLEGIKIVGISSHIGSQVRLLQPFLDALDNVLELVAALRQDGIALEHIDVGGGLGIATPEQTDVPQPAELSQALLARLADSGLCLHLEPGRSLVGNAGYLLARVVGVKQQSGHCFVMLDAGMNDYIRPALYKAFPACRNVSVADWDKADDARSDIVGPVCETGDTFVRGYPLSAKRGDVVALAGVGAYGMAMSSDYNSRPKAAEVLVIQGEARLIRRRQSIEDLMTQEMGLY